MSTCAAFVVVTGVLSLLSAPRPRVGHDLRPAMIAAGFCFIEVVVFVLAIAFIFRHQAGN